MKSLWKTTIVIWSEFDPQNFDITTMAQEAMDGLAYCSSDEMEYVQDPALDPNPPSEEFFLDEEVEDD